MIDVGKRKDSGQWPGEAMGCIRIGVEKGSKAWGDIGPMEMWWRWIRGRMGPDAD